MVPIEAVNRIRAEVAQYSLEKLKHSLDLLSRYGYMNSPEDNVERKLIRERLEQLKGA
jgi:hypothetical protein